MTPEEIERHPHDYDWHARFPDSVRVAGAEGGAVFIATAQGAWWIIIDEGTLVEFLDPVRDGHLFDTLVTIRRYASAADWHAAIDAIRQSHLPPTPE